jgi:hypothetical protein
MRTVLTILVTAMCLIPTAAQTRSDGPTGEKAQKTYKQALQELHDRKLEFALEDFKKPDKQDGGHCAACQNQMLKYGVELREWKTAETAAEELVANAQGPKEAALAHYQCASLFFREGLDKHKDEFFYGLTTKQERRLPLIPISRTPCPWMAGHWRA